jgi:hypothetical protein
MQNRLASGIVAATLLTTAVAPTGCGYFLYPERRGNTSNVDGGTLVMDLLWLLPGIVPGVVALIVDFSSGAIYRDGGGRYAVVMSPDGRVAVRLPATSKPTQLEFRLVTADHRILAKKTALVGPTSRGESLELRIGDAMRPGRNETIYLEVASANGAARFPTSLQVAR